jgi:citrate lyase subunit beta/citryl-CoA lyase
VRPRRSCLAVPGSNPRFLDKAQGLPADEVFLDLEDACAPLAKPGARHAIVAALIHGDWGSKTRVVRVNDWTTHWTYQDVITVVEGAGAHLDCIMLPNVAGAAQVQALDLLLTQIEKTMGLEVGRIGIEAQIESAAGLVNVDAIAASSPRLETLVFGPADFMASIGMRSLVVGEQPPGYPADAYHYALMRILTAARARGLQPVDGPYLQIRNAEGSGSARRIASACERMHVLVIRCRGVARSAASRRSRGRFVGVMGRASPAHRSRGSMQCWRWGGCGLYVAWHESQAGVSWARHQSMINVMSWWASVSFSASFISGSARRR